LPWMGALSRVLSPEAGRLSVKTNETAENWAQRCWDEFKRFIPEVLPNGVGCGQLIIAEK